MLCVQDIQLQKIRESSLILIPEDIYTPVSTLLRNPEFHNTFSTQFWSQLLYDLALELEHINAYGLSVDSSLENLCIYEDSNGVKRLGLNNTNFIKSHDDNYGFKEFVQMVAKGLNIEMVNADSKNFSESIRVSFGKENSFTN